eukprot:Opistho-2@48628
MFRLVASRALRVAVARPAVQRSFSALAIAPRPALATLPRIERRGYSHAVETDAQFDARWEAFFKDTTIDSWDLRFGLENIFAQDLVPEPKILIAAFHACRRLNDFASTVRTIEAVREKAGSDAVYNQIVSALQPTMKELGIPTPEELGIGSNAKA